MTNAFLEHVRGRLQKLSFRPRLAYGLICVERMLLNYAHDLGAEKHYDLIMGRDESSLEGSGRSDHRPHEETTRLLRAWTAGDHEAGDAIFSRLYEDLRGVASRKLASEDPGRTLQTTDLVHEAFLRMVDQSQAQWQDRSQFFAVAARVMRRIIIDHARARLAKKRWGSLDQVTLADAEGISFSAKPKDLVALDECLEDLQHHDAHRARLVELRFFAGLSLDDTAAVLGISRATAVRQWKVTKGWLHRQLSTR